MQIGPDQRPWRGIALVATVVNIAFNFPRRLMLGEGTVTEITQLPALPSGATMITEAAYRASRGRSGLRIFRCLLDARKKRQRA